MKPQSVRFLCAARVCRLVDRIGRQRSKDFRHSSCKWLWLAAPMLFASVVLSSCAAAAQESIRVIDEDPYDVLTLKEDGQQFKVVPLEMAKRRPPTAGSADSKLLVRLQKRPEQQYQIAWGDIEKVQLFEEIVLSEARKLVDARAFDEAFEYYEFIKNRAPDFPGLVDAQRTCMFREAEHWGQQGQYGHVLALLNELYEQDARYPDLKRAIGVAVDRLVEQYFSKEENAAARVLLAELDDRFPDHEVVKKRRQELIDRSNRALQEARAESEKARCAKRTTWQKSH